MDKVSKYSSKGKIISRSTHHNDMWIIDLPDNTFYTIYMSEKLMLSNNLPDLIENGIPVVDRRPIKPMLKTFKAKFTVSSNYYLN